MIAKLNEAVQRMPALAFLFSGISDPAPLTSYVMPKVRQVPGSPEQLLEELFEIFPECRTSYKPFHDDAPTFHSVLLGFNPLVTTSLGTCSKSQLLAFANLVNAAVKGGGDLENAFGTCFLEHLGQLGALNTLRPHLSQLAREKNPGITIPCCDLAPARRSAVARVSILVVPGLWTRNPRCQSQSIGVRCRSNYEHNQTPDHRGLVGGSGNCACPWTRDGKSFASDNGQRVFRRYRRHAHVRAAALATHNPWAHVSPGITAARDAAPPNNHLTIPCCELPPALGFAECRIQVSGAVEFPAQSFRCQSQMSVVKLKSHMRTFGWKHFNWTAASCAFLTVLFLDFVIEGINLVFFDTATASWGETVLAVPFWVIHFIGFPLLICLRHGFGETLDLIVIALIYLLGAVFWSTIAGYRFSSKKNA